jgi:VIT1/CCC1 family predicted Fe2+/Mn2+ transporter
LSDDEGRARQGQYREYLKSELEAAAVYSALADTEKDPGREEVFRKLVDAEMRHAARWAEKLGMDPAGLEPGIFSFKVRLVQWVARLIGTSRVVPVLLRGEAKEVKVYAADPEARDMALEERQHARTLRGLTKTGAGAVWSPGGVRGSGGSLRAAVLGVNDGLVSNFSLVMGVAGGTGNNADIVLLAGVAGLLAGAFSMAAGEYVSMRSQREIYENEIRKERAELEEWPEEEEEELQLIYQAKGLSPEESSQVAKWLMADPEVVLDTMAREELGLDPSQLGSPWRASSSSFVAFVVGASFPIAPYIFDAGALAFSLSAFLSGAALVTVGGLLALVSGRNVAWGALRMLLAGGAAAAVTFGVGRFIGVSLLG